MLPILQDSEEKYVRHSMLDEISSINSRYSIETLKTYIKGA